MNERIVDMSNEKDKALFLNDLRRLQGIYRFEFVRFRPRRSDRQNRYFHPCVCDEFAKFLTDQGQPTTMLEAKEIIKQKFLKRNRVDPNTGEVLEYVARTRDLDTAEFNELLDQSSAWLADMFGIIIPEPGAYHEKVAP